MSDLYLTPQHEQFRQAVRTFAETEVAPRVAEMERSGAVERDLASVMAQQGWIGATIAPKYGGMGAGHLAKTVIVEEVARVSAAMGAVVQASQLGVAKIIHFGNDEQKKMWLPRIAAGLVLPTIAVTEPESGSHVLGMQATAQRRGDEYILNGRKCYIGNSHIGDLHGIVVRTSKKAGPRALSAFLVESDRPGLSLGEHRPAMGLRGFSFGELILENCRVPAANLLGAQGDGLDVAYSSSVLYGRPNLTAVALGIHQALVEETVAYAQKRVLYGRPLSELPTIREKLGLMRSRLTTARSIAYEAVALLDQGRGCDEHLINAKLVNVELVRDSARAAMDVHGAAGLMTSHPVERLFRDAEHTCAPAGTGDIQILRLGQEALGNEHGQWSLRFPTPLPVAPTGAAA
ncbi:acyl-CoA dehydrogenase family protein [Streptomyces sp. NPDC059970]|uniref:acyl-CoA dehydrogenase family protein n=1 Tax=Streptomyces sp. NPDC059970 TaxID=3347019 RepID=UPI0036C0E8B1